MSIGEVIVVIFAIFMTSITLIIIFAPRERITDEKPKKKVK